MVDHDSLAVAVADREAVGDPVSVGSGVGERVSEADREAVGESVAVGVAESVWAGVIDRDGE